MSNKKKLAVLGVIAAAGISGATYWWQVARFVETTDNAYLQSDIVYVNAKQSGYAEAGWIEDNQRVEKGDILARIDDRDYKLRLEETKAEVNAEQAHINQLMSQRKLQMSLIQVAESNLVSANAEKSLTTTELERIKNLSKKGVISKDKLDKAITANLKATAQVKGVKASIESSKRKLDVLDSDINAAEADLQKAQIRQAMSEQSLSETTITAPRSGIIGQRQIKDGQLVHAKSVLYSIVDNDTVWVTANFKETQIGHMSVGQPVELSVDAYPDHPITGYIQSIWPASGARFSILPPENATGNFTKIIQRIPVKIVIPSDQKLKGRLLAGMSVVVKVNTKEKPVDVSLLTVTDNNLKHDVQDQQLARN